MTTTLTRPPVAPAGSGIVHRQYRGLADVAGMGAANARLRTSVGLLEPIDVAAMEHSYTHLVNSDPLTDCVIVERDGTTAGYARVEWHDLTDGDELIVGRYRMYFLDASAVGASASAAPAVA